MDSQRIRHVVYIPGLNDHRAKLQYKVVRAWRLLGVKVTIEPMNWSDQKSYDSKLEHLLATIDMLHDQGHEVSLVGVSAGASMALNAFAVRPHTVYKVACICGKINHPETVANVTYQRNPAFKESMDLLENSINNLSIQQLERIRCIHPLADNIVPIADTKVDGASEKTIPVVGHTLGIVYAITLGSLDITSFMKKQLY